MALWQKAAAAEISSGNGQSNIEAVRVSGEAPLPATLRPAAPLGGWSGEMAARAGREVPEAGGR